MKYPTHDNGEYYGKTEAQTWARSNGGPRRPQPPRNLLTQGGSRKVQIFWDMPEDPSDIIGWKIYADNENALLDSIYDPNVRQYNAPASAGSSPATRNFFVSSFSKRGESAKVQVQGAATVESGAPTDPPPPSGSAASGTTGKTVGVDGAGFNRSEFEFL